MLTLARRLDALIASLQLRFFTHPDMLAERSYNSNKPRFHGLFHSLRHLRALAPVSLLLLGLFCVYRSVPFFALRAALCRVVVTPADVAVRNEIVLDRFAQAAVQSGRPTQLRALTTLVMVAGHAIYTGLHWEPTSLRDERNWMLEPFQQGQVDTFLQHVQRGVQLAANDSSALLLFSGGQTRQYAGPRSEAMTYWMAAQTLNWFGYASTHVQNRTFAEEYARDSMENLLFSICRFNQLTGTYPRVIKVVGFAFKKYRFTDLHRRAIRFPAHRFKYYGVDPDKVKGIRGVTAGERAHALGPFAADPYGCNSPVLGSKRRGRNPYLRYHPYPQGCPELSALFRHCGRSIFKGPLPWDPRAGSTS
ncbi:hypothetical protein BWQ96_07938 [Gracilariopsis chorda]|uniref:DUF218 domain-containing protein n=1 Tax=Gracilariopsis chorda TaxID=448386 RepID=A0A2V3IJU1_9FLOR|nr:hypothetical protein BWQ96_07938 [Gracilariopsis chorda]|eukprot:PXF42303.1 hypothetical protein BWQ96_07938 [Gracilariopsis chorda]